MLGEAEIREVRFALRVEEDVRGLEVAVKDAVLMGVMDGVGDFGEKTDVRGQRADVRGWRSEVRLRSFDFCLLTSDL